jgi:hypothetical protein
MFSGEAFWHLAVRSDKNFILNEMASVDWGWCVE